MLRRDEPRSRKEAESTRTSRPLQKSSPWKWWILLLGCSHCTVSARPLTLGDSSNGHPDLTREDPMRELSPVEELRLPLLTIAGAGAGAGAGERLAAYARRDLQLEVGLSVDVGRLDVGRVLRKRAGQDDEVGGDLLVAAHLHDVAHLDWFAAR